MQAEPNKRKPIVFVTGDVCRDVYIATTHDPEHHNLWRTGHEWATFNEGPGCSWLLKELLDQTLGDQCKVVSFLPAYSRDKQCVLSLNLTTKFSNSASPSNAAASAEDATWRISEFLGQQNATDKNGKKYADHLLDYTFDSNAINSSDLVVIDDKNLGFRDRKKIVDKILHQLKSAKLIIFRMARPLCDSSVLWKKFQEHGLLHKTVLVFPVSDLRFADVEVGQSLSWEQIVSDVICNITNSKSIEKIDECLSVIVSFDDSGALLYLPSNRSATLCFRPETIEGQRVAKKQGRVSGYAYCLISALARRLAIISNDTILNSSENLEKALRAGVVCGIELEAALYEKGFLASVDDSRAETRGPNGEKQFVVSFPFERIAQTLQEIEKRNNNNGKPSFDGNSNRTRSEAYRVESFQLCQQPLPRDWSILECKLASSEPSAKYLCELIIEHGVEQAIWKFPIPYWRVSKSLLLINRKETEGMRGMSALMRAYVDNGSKKGGPLSIAVFGPPGSGKSFAIKQLTESFGKSGEIDIRTFNLSQFNDPDELIDAFHQVRSIALSGKLPLVFWDEFDTKDMEWLRYFLAPMQDGQFVDGQLIHSIGQAIFVFAGGVFERSDELLAGVGDWKKKKVPDFVSRLSGSLDILGINTKQGTGDKVEILPPDPECRVRRAVLLRSKLEQYAPKAFPPRKAAETEITHGAENYYLKVIDKGLFHALLNIREYKHGARSLEAIVANSNLSMQRKYTRSALPPRDALRLHVDVDEFFSLMDQAPDQ